MAILFAEASPEIELLGITTVFGNATIQNGTRNALYLKKKFNMKADIAQGASKPLVRDEVGPTVIVHGEQGFGYYQISSDFNPTPPPISAVDYMIKQVKKYPHEITLVAVGPLTNLAHLLQKEPDIVSLVKQVVIMGGAFGHNGHFGNVAPFAEANIYDDPDAADLVFCADWPVVILGLDVTQQSFFSGEYLDQLKEDAGEVGEFIWDVSRYYLEFYSKSIQLDGCHVHDPSAIAYVINPDLFTLQQGPVRVIKEGVAMGMTIQKITSQRHPNDDWSDKPAQNIGISVNDQALLRLYRESLIGYNS
ncbi:nucleoside hydrolase [Vibrio sp. SS-MA-C1-2]|uniref:nucleoside hydrolase n=1 Tax=Vibrio sp. SS-MA-C1-2 TaxID=2908646 RepID=UPI001F446419|nr:nucleoside hydrolase [Vibrio sp. SS-MA-C1-2]